MQRDGYPTFLHREPDWDEVDQWTDEHWFSGIGAAWVRDLLARGIDVVWATTWQHHANTHFAPILGLPELPVAVHGSGYFSESSPHWKARKLARQFDARPLLWVDDNPIRDRPFDQLRRPHDRALTNAHWIKSWHNGITARDVTEMDDWLSLAATTDGQQELRVRRRRALDRQRARQRRQQWGSETSYRSWHAVRARLETELGLDDDDIGLLASHLRTHPDRIDREHVALLMAEFGHAITVPAESIVDILRHYRQASRKHS
ncbi:hypothetical protein [Microbacterium invictum]